jgi:hypothetical protein
MPFIRRNAIWNGEVTAVKLASNAFSGTILANAATYNANTTAATLVSPLVVPFLFTDGTATIEVTMPYKVRVIDVSHLKVAANAGGNNTVQVFNGASAVTGAIVAYGNDQVLQTTGFSIDDATMEVASGGLLKVTSTKVGTNSACIVYVTVLRVA